MSATRMPDSPAGYPASTLTARTAAVTVLAQTVGRAVTLGAVIVSTAVVARAVGIATYADWASVLSLVAMLAFTLDPGLSPVVVRRLAQNPAQAPSPQAMLAVRLALAGLSLAVVCGATAAIRGTGALELALALGAQVLPRALVLNVGAWLQADHRLHRQSAMEALTAILGLAALIAAAALDASVVVLAVVGFLAPAAVLAFLMSRELRRTPSYATVVPGDQRPRVRSVLAEVAPLAAALLLVAVYTRIHVVFINAAEDAAGTARYLFAFQFVEQIIVLASIATAALLPMFAVRAGGVELLAERSSRRLLIGLAGVGALGSEVLVGGAVPLAKAVGGAKLAGASGSLVLLAPMSVLLLVAFMLAYLFLALGLAARYLRFNVVALCFCLVGHAVFTLHYGAPAAARVSWMTEALVVAMASVPLWRGHPATGLRLGAVVAVTVLSAELTTAGIAAPVLAAVGGAAAVLVLSGAELRWLAERLRRR
jgi:O-antigen/teichoic acid export membrane protein